MSLASFAKAALSSDIDLISTDIFDTLLLRDWSLQRARFAEIGRLAGERLRADPHVVSELRQLMHDLAYKAVAAEGPDSDARLSTICRAIAAALGFGQREAELIREVEIGVEIAHLSPNLPFIDHLRAASRSGLRIVAVSDTYYSAEDLRRIIAKVAGPIPIEAIYSSADLALTKHGGRIFAEVARRETLAQGRILHVGDNWEADVVKARAAGWSAIHLVRRRQWQARPKAFVGGALEMIASLKATHQRAWF